MSWVVERFGQLGIAFSNAGVENKAQPLHEIEGVGASMTSPARGCRPARVDWFTRSDPVECLGSMPQGALVALTEEVPVDRRGDIFVTDRNQSSWVRRYSEPGAQGAMR